MNILFPLLAIAAVLWTAIHQIMGGHDAMAAMTETIARVGADAIQLGLTLAGMMALFLGLMRVIEDARLLPHLARPLVPLLGWLFPSFKRKDPAVQAMALNLSANLLGMGNAATPFGVRAMELLQNANSSQTSASNAQIMFLALNTAGITLFPAKVIALRASLGSAAPAIIMGPTLASSLCAALAGITAARLLGGRGGGDEPRPLATALLPLAGIGLLAIAMMVWGSQIGTWMLPMLIAVFLILGLIRGVPVYESFVEGARDGLMVTWRILPYILAIVVAVGLARASGALDQLLLPLGHVLAPLGVPPEALLMAVTRTLSGSGSFGLLASYLGQAGSGPDTPLGVLLSTIYGSTETTFYVIAVNFGAVGIRDLRHAVAVGLIADAAGLMAATLVCPLVTH
jgi:spore maturation protein SpmA/spore maturation protein SpmB